ncbi:MAG: ABC transporter substrate binding protein [Eubacteriales bacterium]|jgi:ABC-type uncharacterized transport system substrate-binding protein
MKPKISRVLICILAGILLLGLISCGREAGYNIPIVCGETNMNNVCGIATYGVNYYNLGVKAGDMAADILLEGADVSKMPVQFDPNPALSVNTAVAEEIGFKIPEGVLAKVTDDSTLDVTRVDSAIVSSGGDFTVGILQLVQHIALDEANWGFQDQLSVRMASAGKTVTILSENAAGEQSNNITIAETFVGMKVDLIYTIATSSSQASAAATEEIPIVFCAVTNPIEAGLVESLENPGRNVTGVSDINPVADQIDLIAELLGKEKITIGLLYTASETNSEYQIRLAKQHCEAKGYSYVVKGINDLNDIQNAFIALKDVDAIYIPTDNVLASGAATVHSINIGGE